jgi:hypothetical protein
VALDDGSDAKTRRACVVEDVNDIKSPAWACHSIEGQPSIAISNKQ